MKKGLIISIILMVLGFIFECLYLLTDIRLFQVKLWVLGIVLLILGFLGILWYGVVPIMEDRADKLGRFKGQQKKRS